MTDATTSAGDPFAMAHACADSAYLSVVDDLHTKLAELMFLRELCLHAGATDPICAGQIAIRQREHELAILLGL